MSIKTQWLETYPEHTFNLYSYYLKLLYSRPAYRISVDAGFSCPHRQRSKNRTGCLYCADRGSRAPYLGDETNIRLQIKGGMEFLKKRYKAEIFLLYFQAYSGTYAEPEQLKKIYDCALECAPFRELIISTRPDCIDAKTVELLKTYTKKNLKVWVELGLQSSFNDSLDRMNRKHTVEDFLNAYYLLKENGILVTIHLIYGLPLEGMEDIIQTAQFIAELKPDGVKIHNLHILKNAPLFEEFLCGELVTPCAERHLDFVIKSLEYLPPETVIMRLTCDSRKQDLASPLHFWEKSVFYKEVSSKMMEQRTWQGRKYTP